MILLVLCYETMLCYVSNITIAVFRLHGHHLDSMFSNRSSRILLVPWAGRIRPLSTSSPAGSGHNKVRFVNTTKQPTLYCFSPVVENPAKERIE